MVKIYKENDKIIMEDGDNIVEVTKIVHDNKTGKDWYTLPENSANRKCIVADKVTEQPLELEYKETRVVGPRGSGKKLEDYMTPEERATVDAIMEACRERKLADKPQPKTELQKAMDLVAKYQAKVAALQAAQNN